MRLADGRVLIMGGTIPFKGICGMACAAPPTASVEVFDPRTGKFRSGGTLVEPRTNASALLLEDGRVLVYGGLFLNSLEIYDPAKGSSARVKLPPAIPALPTDPTVALLRDGRVLIAGGSYDEQMSSSDATLIFDPVTGAFSKGPRLTNGRQGATAAVLADGRVLLVGGEYFSEYIGHANGDAELIDPSRPLAPSTVVYPQGNSGLGPQATSVLLSDGRVLVTGGGLYDEYAGCLTPEGPQIFDPATDAFVPAGPLKTPRSGSKMVRIEDGRVLLFGGTDATCNGATTIEGFDPDSGTFQVVATGFPLITDFSLTLLEDGRVLIVGGANDTWNGMTTASWLLAPR